MKVEIYTREGNKNKAIIVESKESKTVKIDNDKKEVKVNCK